MSVKLSFTFSSKNKKSLNLFQNYLKKQFIKNSIKNNKVLKKSNKNKRFTFLRSPHIHKSSQETFSFNVFTKKICLIFYYKLVHFIYLIKNLVLSAFYDIKFYLSFDILKIKTLLYFNKLNLYSINKLKLTIKFYQKKRIQTKKFINFLNLKGLLKTSLV